MKNIRAELRRTRQSVERTVNEPDRSRILELLDNIRTELGTDDVVPTLLNQAAEEANRCNQSKLAKKIHQIKYRFEQNEEQKESEPTSFRTLATIAGTLGLLIGALVLFICGLISKNVFLPDLTQKDIADITEISGPFGDTFGIVTAFFSSIAFGGVLYTTYLQRRELALQREEVRFARREASRSADALHNQVVLSLQSARISGLSAICQFLNSVITDQNTPEVREAKGRRAWHAEQMQYFLSRMLTGEVNVGPRNDVDWATEINNLLDYATSHWAEEKPSTDAPDQALQSAVRNLLLYIAERLGAIHYFAHPESTAFQAVGQIQDLIRTTLYASNETTNLRHRLNMAVINVFAQLKQSAALPVLKPLS